MILAQARRIPVRVVADDRIVAGRCRARLRRGDCRVPVREQVVPIGAAPADDVLRQILVVGLRAIGIVVVAGQRSVADRLHRLQVVHPCFLSRRRPSTCRWRNRRRRDRRACRVPSSPLSKRANVRREESLPNICAASTPTSLSGLAEKNSTAPPRLLERRGVDRARALRQHGATDQLSRNRAADVQAVVIAVGHVTERHAVEREAERF